MYNKQKTQFKLNFQQIKWDRNYKRRPSLPMLRKILCETMHN